jgi:hypothetical protein
MAGWMEAIFFLPLTAEAAEWWRALFDCLIATMP